MPRVAWPSASVSGTLARVRFAVAAVLVIAACSSYGDGTPAPAIPDRDSGAIDANAGAGADGAVATDAAADVARSPACDGGLACERIVFVSSSTGDGNQAGVAGADKECQELANAGSKTNGRSFRAWMSETGYSVTARFVHGTLAYRRTDGVLVANDWEDLLSGSIRAPINADENGTPVGAATVWTGTRANGSLVGTPCTNWTSTSGSARAGSTTKVDSNWTDDTDQACASAQRIYCIEN